MKIAQLIKGGSVAIFGHLRPDGDCVGTALGLYNYIKDNYPEIKADLYLEKFPESFNMIRYASEAREFCPFDKIYDTVFVVDTSSEERIGAGGREALKKCGFSCNIDHHVSNPGNICEVNHVVPDGSSAAEVLYYMLEPDKVSRQCAEALYLGISHDTGIFKYSSTHRSTLLAVADLIDKGVDFTRIIDETYYHRTLPQTVVTGFVLMNVKQAIGGKVAYGYLTSEQMKHFGVSSLEMDGIIDAIRELEGNEVAIFMYPLKGGYKISLRSKNKVDVNVVASHFSGGGHVKAAGGQAYGDPETIIVRLCEYIKEQL